MDVVQPAVVMTTRDASRADVPAPTPRKARPRLRHRLEFVLLKSAVAIAAGLPISWVTGIAATIVGLVGPRLRQNRRALQNLAVAFPEKSAAEHQAIARAMWANMGRLFAETFVLDRIIADPTRIELLDNDYWRTRMREPGTTIACTLHAGNWELSAWPLVQLGLRPAGVYRPLANPLVNQWLVEMRSRVFPGGLLGKGDNDDDARSGQRTARLLIDVTRKGGCIGFVCDHVDRRGTPIPFMGRHARFTTVPAMIARHVGSRLWVGFCRRVGTQSRFRMELRELEVVRTGDKAADTLATTTAMFAVFEHWIRENPEQWMWWNTKWLPQESEAVPPADAEPASAAPGERTS